MSVFGLSLASDKGFYYVLLAAAVLSTLVIIVIQRSRMGRLLGALADSPVALETQGAATNVIRSDLLHLRQRSRASPAC